MARNLKIENKILERFDRLPKWPFTYWLFAVLGVSFFFTFFDTVAIGFAFPKIMIAFAVSHKFLAWAVTANLMGYVVGSFLCARISDIYGRRVGAMLSMAFYSVGTVLMASSPGIGWFIAWRVLAGMGLGGEISCCVCYATELSPSRYRGRAVAMLVIYGFCSFAVTPFIALAILPNFVWGWRYLFILGGVGGAIFFFLRRFLPESPRWLIANGKISEAERIVKKAEKTIKARGGKPLSAPVSLMARSTTISDKGNGLSALLFSPYLKYLCIFVFVWVFYYIGNFGFLTLQTTILINLGLHFSSSLLLISVQSLGFLAGATIAILITDRFERKWTCVMIAIIWAVSLFVIGLFNAKITTMLFGFICAVSISAIIPIMYAYTAETFPTRFRATSIAITDGLAHFAAAFSIQIILFFYKLFSNPYESARAALWVMAATGLITAIILLFGKKLTNSRLEN